MFCFVLLRAFILHFVLHLRVTTDPELNKSIESIKERKSDIKTQFSHYQSELDKLIKTEKRLKEMYVNKCVCFWCTVMYVLVLIIV